MTRGEVSNHSQDLPSKFFNVRTEETVRAPEQRAKIKAVSLHQLTSSRDWYCSLSEKETEKETGVEEDKTEKKSKYHK